MRREYIGSPASALLPSPFGRGRSEAGGEGINQVGSILIALVVILLVMALAGAATFYLTTSSSYTGLLKNNNLKAYYLAESGARFAGSLIQTDLNNGNQDNMDTLFRGIKNGQGVSSPTYTLSTGQFTLTVSNVTNSSATLASTGVTGSGLTLTKRQVVYQVEGSAYEGSPTFSDLNNNPPDWNQTSI